MKYLLDSTALLAYRLDEPEAERVEALIFDAHGGAAVNFATWVEIQGCLRALGLSSAFSELPPEIQRLDLRCA